MTASDLARFRVLAQELLTLVTRPEVEPPAPQGPPRIESVPAPGPNSVLVDRILVEEWLVLSAQTLWRGARTTVPRGARQRALHTLAHIRDVAAVAGIDLDHVRSDDTEERLVNLSADDDAEASLGWGLIIVEQEITEMIERDAKREATSTRRSR